MTSCVGGKHQPLVYSPSPFELALCMTILQTKPEHLFVQEYIAVIRSLIKSSGGPGKEHRYIDHPELLKQLLDVAKGEAAELKVKVLELERKNARTCSAPGCQSRDKTGESKQKPKSKRKQPSDAGEAPNAFRNELLLHLPLKRWTIDASSSNDVPRLVNSLHLLDLSTSSQALSSAILDTCFILPNIVRPWVVGPFDKLGCKPEISTRKSRHSQAKEALPPAEPSNVDTASTCSMVHLTCQKLLQSLDYLKELEGHHQSRHSLLKPGKEDNSIQTPLLLTSLNSFINLLRELLLLIYINSKTSIESKFARGSASTSFAAASLRPHSKDIQCQGPEVPDLRYGLMNILRNLLHVLQPHLRFARDINEAIMLFTLELLGGSTESGANAREYDTHQCPDKVGEDSKQNAITQITNQLAFDEASWFWLQILRKALSTSKEHLSWLRSQQFDTGILIQDVNYLKLAQKVELKLSKAIYQSTFGTIGCGRSLRIGADGNVSPNAEQYTEGVRLVNKVLVNEVWGLLGVGLMEKQTEVVKD